LRQRRRATPPPRRRKLRQLTLKPASRRRPMTPTGCSANEHLGYGLDHRRRVKHCRGDPGAAFGKVRSIAVTTDHGERVRHENAVKLAGGLQIGASVL
jgi:hypothetical protein